MKKTIKNIAMAALCLFLSSQAGAQTAALKIGDKVPDITINNVINYKSSSLKLSDFKGKLLILDFWATWCSPCIAMIPKLDSLQKAFPDQVQFISVTYQDEKVVSTFMNKLHKQKKTVYDLPLVVADKVLNKLFPHNQLPHYVWISRAGEVIAITGYKEITADKIRQVLNQSEFKPVEKKDIALISYDKARPLLSQVKGSDSLKLIYQSLLTGFNSGLKAGWDFTKADSITGRKIVTRNIPLIWFYRLAYGGDSTFFPVNRVMLEVSEPGRFTSTLRGNDYDDWMKAGNVFCYELIVPPALSQEMFKLMQEDTKRLFPQYRAGVEKKRTKCLALVRTSNVDKIATHYPTGITEEQIDALGLKVRNSALASYVSSLKVAYLQKYPVPLVDETGYAGRIDMDLNASLSDVAAMNRELEKYDLKWVEKETEVGMLVIRDAVNGK